MTAPLADQIRALLDADVTSPRWTAKPRLVCALQSVLDLRMPAGWSATACENCCCASWPCTTVLTVAAALGIDTMPATGTEVPR